MTKQEQFLYAVQTLILTNGINLSSNKDLADKYRHVYSVSGVNNKILEALRISEIIPEDMTAMEAADDFCSVFLDNLKDNDKIGPAWLMRH